EIRTPLGAILGFTDLLRDPGISAEEKMGYLDIISRNGKSLTRVIDDILDLSKVEAGHLEIEKTPFCMPDVLSEIVSLFSETVKAKDLYLTLTIDSNVPGTVLSDPARLRQILINIIGNAVKFTSVGGIKVKVESSPIGDRTAKIIISVSDTGPGLMRSQQKKLFQPFTQADNTTTRKFGGTGLGLALSRRLAQAMGGNIGISACKIRRGCTFQISIEVGLPEGLAVAMSLSTPTIAASLQPKVLSHARVLLVEDAVDNQVLIKRILTKNGAEVDLASNGLEGMQKALDGKGKYTIVLMDIQMPIMDGYEAIRKLRASGYRGPVFALTAHAMAEERKKTQAAGYDGHLTKPLDTDVLIQTVRKFS
ncbi:MAG: response regulator, partial [Proteobacteria bacterium]